MTELEKAQLRNVDADTDTKLIQVQVISAEEARKRVADDPDTPYVDLDRTVQPPGPPAEPDPNAPPPRRAARAPTTPGPRSSTGIKRMGLGPPPEPGLNGSKPKGLVDRMLAERHSAQGASLAAA